MDLEGFKLRDGTIIRGWHPQEEASSSFGRRKTLTPFLLWRGPLAPTARLNFSTGAGWITPASLRKRHRIGAGFVAAKRRIEKLALSSPGEYLILDQKTGQR